MATQTLQSLFHLTALGTSVAIAGEPVFPNALVVPSVSGSAPPPAPRPVPI